MQGVDAPAASCARVSVSVAVRTGPTEGKPMLINRVAYQEGRKLRDIDAAEIPDYLQQPGCFVWVALRDATPAELSAMQAEFGLHELAVEDAVNGQQRPKIEEYENSVFVTAPAA